MPNCRGWILSREIPNTCYRDAMGCYPLFCCQNWSSLRWDLERFGSDLVSVALVTGPFGEYTVRDLQNTFDVVIPFKFHFIIDLTSPGRSISRHHHYYARRALRQLEVEVCTSPVQFAEEWIQLYGNVIERHRLSGIKAFSASSLTRQLLVPGAVLFHALQDGKGVSAQLWFVQGDVAYSHLAASNHQGYKLRAPYALHSSAIEYFKGKVRSLDLGGSAGVEQSEIDGLSLFKKGWGTSTRTAYFCGRVLNRAAYKQLVARHITGTPAYFPAYRAGEFS